MGAEGFFANRITHFLPRTTLGRFLRSSSQFAHALSLLYLNESALIIKRTDTEASHGGIAAQPLEK
ncbi:hypothetical protein FR965_03085 [Serratia marcescens]|uniref:hypothetical protein n=1 Tax=Serratia marcescens TaxID=615 RepID=UPI00093076A0|nr:hypothetical protein [Serratia marcescens]AVU37431.1 hypothetical protein AM681_23835 [Serratia marcescens]AVU42518.1 hypothetical protein AS658_23495 [Serratia marcescens]TWY32938.1 hypothetical protein FR965_03085 [Serratia marcescens]TWY39384.1 hypothetical protein FR992_06005 [Serratia marcescens]TYR87530.1 hypothetical protein FYK38_18490 [Serratia marcescens]